MGSTGRNVERLIGSVIVMFLAIALMPSVFTNIFGLNETEVPLWVKTIVGVITGAVFVLIIWRAGGE